MILKVHLDVVLGMRTVNHQNCKCWAFKYIVVLFYILLVRVLYSTTHGNLLKRPWTLVLEGIWVGLIIIMFTYLYKESSIHWYNLGSWSTGIFLSCVFCMHGSLCRSGVRDLKHIQNALAVKIIQYPGMYLVVIIIINGVRDVTWTQWSISTNFL